MSRVPLLSASGLTVFKEFRSQPADTVHTVGQLLLSKARKDKDVTTGLVGAGADGRVQHAKCR